ncbi:hypothetical protein [Mycobacterium sp. 29Ha]|uniref:hypothetical protein n=1 Tax=Mycobacterium sp. 29Ha TaxID=2939268 RepID=UPI0029391E2F|nr:hypothetical protein [Mycobacterium sp. 29Ha]MDV3136823.1 hypothetical protein [Mycobacterium sp. 29Ha]
MEAILLLGAGALAGVLATVFVQPAIERLKHRGTSRVRTWFPTKAGGYDLQEIYLYQIMSWSASRPLDPGKHRVQRDTADRPPQEWFPPAILEREVHSIRARVQGEVCEVTDSTVDHGESGNSTKGFTLRVRPSEYADSLVLPRLLADDELWKPLQQRIMRHGILETLAVAPPRSFFVNLTVSTTRGEVLMTRRSASAASAAGLRSLGVCETMNAIPMTAGHEPEDLFDLAHRAAREELGLERSDIGPIWFTWYGFGRYHGQFAVAHTQTRLSADEVEVRARSAEAGWEADALRWIDVKGKEMRGLATIAHHEGWLPLTPITAQGLLDIWPYLATAPKRY